MAPLGGASFYIGFFREIHLKYSLSKTTELILTKFAWKYLGAQKEATVGEILGIWKIFLSQTNGTNALIFSMKQPWDKEIQVCSNKVPGVINGPIPRKGPKRGIF